MQLSTLFRGLPREYRKYRLYTERLQTLILCEQNIDTRPSDSHCQKSKNETEVSNAIILEHPASNELTD